jgi:uroporphyrinogen-III synthase
VNVISGRLRILVTGDREGSIESIPNLENPVDVEWISLPVLKFERLSVTQSVVDRTINDPFHWILFTSPRAVGFWNEVLLEAGVDFPVETQVACIGESTADRAQMDGYSPDFYPTEPGTEKFLEEFESLVATNTVKPNILIPMAEGGRTTLSEKLREMGCEVVVVPLYRTSKREDITERISEEELRKISAIVFTSPSSVDAFLSEFELPSHVKVVSIGSFTSLSLNEKGIVHRVLPGGDFSKLVGEVLC